MLSLEEHIHVVFEFIPFYGRLKSALQKHKEGKHSEAIEIFKDLAGKGCKLAFLNLGNCFMFGMGVERDRKKGLEMYEKCGRVSDDDFLWMRGLSNDHYSFLAHLDLGLRL